MICQICDKPGIESHPDTSPGVCDPCDVNTNRKARYADKG
jgi:hypothetical protein